MTHITITTAGSTSVASFLEVLDETMKAVNDHPFIQKGLAFSALRLSGRMLASSWRDVKLNGNGDFIYATEDAQHAAEQREHALRSILCAASKLLPQSDVEACLTRVVEGLQVIRSVAGTAAQQTETSVFQKKQVAATASVFGDVTARAATLNANRAVEQASRFSTRQGWITERLMLATKPLCADENANLPLGLARTFVNALFDALSYAADNAVAASSRARNPRHVANAALELESLEKAGKYVDEVALELENALTDASLDYTARADHRDENHTDAQCNAEAADIRSRTRAA